MDQTRCDACRDPIEVSAQHFRDKAGLLLDRVLLADQTVLVGVHCTPSAYYAPGPRPPQRDCSAPFAPHAALIPYAQYAEFLALRQRLTTVNDNAELLLDTTD